MATGVKRKQGMNQRAPKLDMKDRFPHLAAAPIVEAAIQWVARASKPFTPKELQGQLAERLAGYPECRPQHQLELQAQLSADGSATQVSRDTWRGFRLTSADKVQIVQFTRDGVVFSRLTPYQDWNTFVSEARRVWEVFLNLAAPSEVQRLGVRFINRIKSDKLVGIGRLLSAPPKGLEQHGLPMSGFLYRNTYEAPGLPFSVNVVQTAQPPAPPEVEGFGLILDIDVFTRQAFPVDDDILNEYLPKMRWLKNKVFFSVMSKPAINSFRKKST